MLGHVISTSCAAQTNKHTQTSVKNFTIHRKLTACFPLQAKSFSLLSASARSSSNLPTISSPLRHCRRNPLKVQWLNSTVETEQKRPRSDSLNLFIWPYEVAIKFNNKFVNWIWMFGQANEFYVPSLKVLDESWTNKASGKEAEKKVEMSSTIWRLVNNPR